MDKMIQLPQNPVFIVGYPRSGTTLLQRLLVTQPGFFSFPETHYFSIIEKQLHIDENDKVEASCLDMVFEKIYEKMKIRFSGEDIKTLHQMADEKKLTSKCVFEFIAAFFLLNQNPCIEHSTGWRWIEKTPTHANFLERILDIYPKSQILHILRHPVPAIFSRKFKFPFNKETPLSRLAYAWNRLVENVERSSKKFPGHIYTLQYEGLVKNIEIELKAVADFINIRFDFSLISRASEKEVNESLILPFETWKQGDKNHDITNTNEDYKNRICKVDVDTIEAIVGEKMKKYHYNPYFS